MGLSAFRSKSIVPARNTKPLVLTHLLSAGPPSGTNRTQTDHAASKQGTSPMTQRGSQQIRDAANAVLDAFLKSVHQARGEQPLTVAELRHLAAAFRNATELEPLYEKAFAGMQQDALSAAYDAQRVEIFHRVMTHPLDPMLEAEELSREALPNFFNFLRLVLGDGVDELQAQCAKAHDELKAKMGDAFTWDALYADPRAKQALWQVLLRVAEAFKRFDARRDWFIGLMQYAPASVSIASNAYVPTPHRDKDWIFGPREFTRMFRCLFAPVKAMTPEDAASFKAAFGKTPEETFTPLLRELG